MSDRVIMILAISSLALLIVIGFFSFFYYGIYILLTKKKIEIILSIGLLFILFLIMSVISIDLVKNSLLELKE